jgi:hypothetical protein
MNRGAGPVSAAVLAVLAVLAAGGRTARAEYRAYELEVVDVIDCKLNKREQCRSARVTTSMSPDLYVQANGGTERMNTVVLATWMCYGDTSGYREICPRPAPRNPKFNAGDEVKIALKKHITQGWRGKVEVVYYAENLKSNVYGVRFADRKRVYARYFERDLEKAGAAPPRTEPPK